MKKISDLICSRGRALLRFLALHRGALLAEIELLKERLERESDRAARAEEERDSRDRQLRALRSGRAVRGRRDSASCGAGRGSIAVRRCEVLYRFQLGQILVGGVTEIAEHGIYVEIEEVTWLVRVPACWRGEVGHPSEVVVVGKRVQVKLIGTRFCTTCPFLVLV